MGTVPIVIFRGLPQSRAQGLGELISQVVDLPGTIQNCITSTGFLGELYTKTALSINLAKTGKRLAYP